MNEQERLRQLDYLIAEKLMGYRDKIEVAQGRSMKTAVDFRPAFKVNPAPFSIGVFGMHFTRDGTKIHYGKPHEIHYPPHYSSSIDAAMTVLETLVSQKMSVSMDNCNNSWTVMFNDVGIAETVFIGESKSLPEAICLAALAAVKEKGPPMTTDEIKRVLAERDGWTPEIRKRYAGHKNVSGWGKNKHLSLGDPERDFTTWLDFDINSKDAIGRVLGKLTEEEWNRFISLPCLGKESFRGTWAQFYLTLPAEVLARCVAEAIKPSAT